MPVQLAQRINRLSPSPIREILSVIDKPGMVSFAGGLPDPASFPAVQSDNVQHYLQYGPSEGESSLREWIADQLQARGIDTHADRIIILSGSQQGIDLVAKLMIDQGTPVAVELPTYLAALQVFSLFGAKYQPYDPTTIGYGFSGKSPRLVYTNPTFQNPTGHVYSSEQRQSLASLCDNTGAVLFEDDPYRELAYDECDRTPVCSLVKSAEWIYQSSFSKTVSPGLRLGYMTCSEALYPHLVQLKQAADLHSNRVAQRIMLTTITRDDASTRLTQVIERYQQKRDLFDALLTRHFSDLASWQQPKGGLFFWLKLRANKAIDTRELLPAAIQANVAFMPGEPFFCDGRTCASALRLNFSHADPDQADRALKRLAALVRGKLTSHWPACSLLQQERLQKSPAEVQ